MADVKKEWYLLYCKGKEELRALTNLENQGIDSFFPTMKIEKKVRNKLTCQNVVIFPNYLFVEIDKRTANFNSIRSTRGVIDFVKCGANYTKVPTALVAELKAKQLCRDKAVNAVIAYDEGEAVIIQDGPFKGIEAIYQCKDGLERSVLLINLIHNVTTLCIANTEIKSKSKCKQS
ncbi:transcription/translation regulatory transformer protein RfaH [Moritella marina ATCC 15381]|uniref:Transcription/translation regulatory transformer protein RfaH n=1 Tax=Moritella marina ATCC 15381 TaxID=1202962 RepID=A0A5J6WG37_MORMI|nr:transcription/translation regulatory transformer protein RfaH [Moritella marina]QFI36906.1 transcription/translation regulatory transformer protein RfaH [Moritella marina ATCC 15381]